MNKNKKISLGFTRIDTSEKGPTEHTEYTENTKKNVVTYSNPSHPYCMFLVPCLLPVPCALLFLSVSFCVFCGLSF
jgi:hypothetical protein